MTRLSVSTLHHAYGPQPVLRGLSLEVPPGAVTAILGASGSGKTTLLRVIAGFERARNGIVRLGETTVDDGRQFVPPHRRRIGYVPQDGALFPHLSVLANIGFGLPRRGRAARARVLADLVGLADLVRRRPHELSGGQQRRVALARALAIRPDLVLLDEPFASLDAALRGSVRTDVLCVLRAAGTTTVLVTHDQDEAFDAADTVAVLRDGDIAQHATPRELYTQPADCELARMIGHANLIPTDIDGDHVTTPLGRHRIRGAGPAGNGTGVSSTGLSSTGLSSTGVSGTGLSGTGVSGTGVSGAGVRGAGVSGAAVVLLRPEQLRVHCRPDGPGLRGRVQESRYHGHDTLVSIRPDEPCGTPVLVARTNGSHDLAPGAPVTVTSRGAVTVYPLRAPGGQPALTG